MNKRSGVNKRKISIKMRSDGVEFHLTLNEYKFNIFCLWFLFQLNDVLQSKQVVEHFAKRDKLFKMIQTKWQSIEQAVDILKMFYLMTKELQRINFTLSDFYGRLIVIKESLKIYLNTADQLDNLAQYLQTELNSRTPLLMKNTLMICAVFWIEDLVQSSLPMKKCLQCEH